MAVEHFKRDDDGYKQWTRVHPAGFVLTRRRNDYSIHESGCGAIFDVLADIRLTASEKVCGDSRRELEQHAIATTKLPPVGCEQCGS